MVTKENYINHAKKAVENDFYALQKSITSIHPKLFPIFKKAFYRQLSSIRMIQYSQKQVFEI